MLLIYFTSLTLLIMSCMSFLFMYEADISLLREFGRLTMLFEFHQLVIGEMDRFNVEENFPM